MTKYYKRGLKYFEKNPNTNSFIHVIGGIGIGFLLTYPLAGSHPVRWGIAFLVFFVLGHIWAATQ